MFGLNAFEMGMMLVFAVLVLIAAYNFVATQRITSGQKRILIYAVVLLATAAAFINIIESKSAMISASAR
jgi:hypothetical protein